jgi:hypothetical protein
MTSSREVAVFKTYRGSCHCGKIQFEVDADISAGTIKCNCSICTKMRIWSVKVKPEHLRLLQGDGELTDYHFNSNVAHHLFCRHCGVRPFDWVDLTPPRAKYYNISVACLDGLDIDELMAAPVTYEDGLNDNWGTRPKEIRHL